MEDSTDVYLYLSDCKTPMVMVIPHGDDYIPLLLNSVLEHLAIYIQEHRTQLQGKK